ncbi:MazG-like family protein [Motiliproteus sediminis]|uniref:MazG-like family protein n=1 Tax=Motiliproteus sediminis TaxID=1468178 RepID=UPI001AEF4A7D|nr:MazG-like family protein [Motiliproteus sediminis]
MSANSNLNELQRAVTAFRDERDWRQFHTPQQLAAALAIEAAELQEQFLWLNEAQIAAKLDDPEGRSAIEDELADVMAYLLCLADVCNCHIGDALKRKLVKNREKYPANLVRGRADKYSAYRNAKENNTTKKQKQS